MSKFTSELRLSLIIVDYGKNVSKHGQLPRGAALPLPRPSGPHVASYNTRLQTNKQFLPRISDKRQLENKISCCNHSQESLFSSSDICENLCIRMRKSPILPKHTKNGMPLPSCRVRYCPTRTNLGSSRPTILGVSYVRKERVLAWSIY